MMLPAMKHLYCECSLHDSLFGKKISFKISFKVLQACSCKELNLVLATIKQVQWVVQGRHEPYYATFQNYFTVTLQY